MAGQLMSSILVHQALHGYNDGHRLVSSSLPIDTSDARIMLVMSDLSGPGLKPPADGYLTGYPLEKAENTFSQERGQHQKCLDLAASGLTR